MSKFIDRIDARGWVGIGIYALTVAVIALIALDKGLSKDEFFKTIATLIIGAFIKDVVGWAYSATKGGGELADRNAEIVSEHARAAVTATEASPTGTKADPAHVTEDKGNA